MVEKYVINGQYWWRFDGSTSYFRPWDGGGDRVSSDDLANRYYLLPWGDLSGGESGFDKMVLQTCIGGNQGLAFVIAYRVK